MACGVGIAREGADSVHGASLVHAAVVTVQQVGVGRKELEHFGEAAGSEARLSRLMPEPSSRWMAVARPCAASSSFATLSDFSRLTGPPRRCAPISRKTWLAV